MYQVAYGGFRKATDETEGSFTFTNAPNVWYEPGFNILFPLEFTVPKCDIVYFLIRRRSNPAGTTFQAPLSASNLTASVIDASSGQEVPAEIGLNEINTDWNSTSPLFYPLVLTVRISQDIPDNLNRIRLLQCTLVDKTGGDFVTFRALLQDNSRPFSYLTVYNGDEIHANDQTTYSPSGVILASQQGSYTLLSPSVSFQVALNASEGFFSYPVDQTVYKRTGGVGSEAYEFSIENVSHVAVNEVVSLITVNKHPGIVALRVDGYARKTLEQLSGVVSFEVHAQSLDSDNSNIDVFKVYLSRKPTHLLVD